MAKKKRASGPKGPFPGVTFTSETIRHVNEQTFAGNSTTEIAEAIPTPGYSEVGYSGCFIVGAQISFAPGVHKGLSGGDNQYIMQIQAGDREATPAYLNPNQVGFFGQLIQNTQQTTSGTLLTAFPKKVSISMPVPIIVLPKITVVHGTIVDASEYQSAVVYTEIFYRTVRLADRAYTGLLLQQQRTS